MSHRVDALVIGAGPAGSATAILLALAGWEVVLVEQDTYPRRKVCGECLSPACLVLLDELGVGAGVRAHAGPELRHIGWMSKASTVFADFPVCAQGPYRYGRALRREHLDGLLVNRALALGVSVLQPARVRAVHGAPGAFRCDIDEARTAQCTTVHAALVVDAHGSWQRGPLFSPAEQLRPRTIHRGSDLFAFKAVFQRTTLRPGTLPVMALPGGYGGMVIADQDEATLACCLRRETLAACRANSPHMPAGEAVEAYLRSSCLGVREALQGAQRAGPWLTVGPLRPGTDRPGADTLLRVGNAVGESHPLIGEGIAMALQSAVLLTLELRRRAPATINAREVFDVQRHYAVKRHHEFSRRLRVAALYAHVAMRPRLAGPVRAILGRWPALLSEAAWLANKARLSSTAYLSPRIHNEHA
jgi:2-polyprenyl-6-methoxyphenol hydroxylase-like FAD-dependent oxidoreductase